MMKKRIASLLAFAMALSFMPSVTMADADPSPEVTVVGKRITDGDPYFEISLEVNGDYADYSSVNVVLEYDPTVIVPAESWDEGAGQADMTENTTWATRRALPTLGKETWSSHIALAYQTEKEVDDGSGGTTTVPVGYLYLGAEYPGETANTSSPEPADGTATAAPTATPDASPEATEEADPDPHQNPVVVARFMYAAPEKYPSGTDEEIADERAKTKEKLEALWQTGEYPAKVSATAADHWDNDWSKNTILTIAPDDVAFESPAQFPYAYYDANFKERAYMHTFPTAAPTADPSASPAATGMPIPTPVHTVYKNGSRIPEGSQLDETDIEVVLGQGKSAKATGGLSLSDIFVIMFYDWDNSLIGTLTAGRGLKLNKDVSNYVEKTMIHPQLQGDYAHLESIERQYTYRGEYPYIGPDATLKNKPGGTGSIPEEIDDGSGTDTMIVNPIAGSKYPLTNKLDYVFAGKEFFEDAPYAGGWTSAEGKDMEAMYTWLNKQEYIDGKFNIIDKETGHALGNDGKPSATQPLPEYETCNFDEIELDSDQTTFSVKAVYRAGDSVDGGGIIEYSPEDNVTYSLLTTMKSETDRVYGIDFNFRRVNVLGYGVSKSHINQVRMKMSVGIDNGGTLSSADTYLPISVENSDIIPVTLTPSQQVTNTGFILLDIIGANVMNGSPISEEYENHFKPDGSDGYQLYSCYKKFLEECYDSALGLSGDYTVRASDLNKFSFFYNYKAKTGVITNFESDSNASKMKTYTDNYIVKAHDEEGYNSPYDFTWYQLQYAMMTASKANKTVLVTPEEAKDLFGDGKDYPDVKPDVPFLDELGRFIP